MTQKTKDNLIAGTMTLGAVAIIIAATLKFGGYGLIIAGTVVAYLVAEC
jgi:hypothetical protein